MKTCIAFAKPLRASNPKSTGIPLRGWILASFIGIAMGLSGCAAPVDPVDRLAALYRDGDGSLGYADSVGEEEIDDPIVYGLEALDDLRATFPLDERELVRTCVVLSTTGCEDPSPSLRSAALWLLRDAFEQEALPIPLPALKIDRAEIEDAVKTLREIGDHYVGQGSLLGEDSVSGEDRARDGEARMFLNALRVEGNNARTLTRNILASIAFEGDRRPLDEDTKNLFFGARGLAEHLAFLAFTAGLKDEDAEVRTASACGLLRLKPNEHYELVLKNFFPIDPDSPLIMLEDLADSAMTSAQRVSLLKELARTPISFETLGPSSRRVWTAILRSRQSAVVHYGCAAVRYLVGAKDGASPEDLVLELGVRDEPADGFGGS